MEYPEPGILHSFRYLMVRSFRVELNSIPVVKVGSEEGAARAVRAESDDEDDDNSVFRWGAGFFEHIRTVMENRIRNFGVVV